MAAPRRARCPGGESRSHVQTRPAHRRSCATRWLLTAAGSALGSSFSFSTAITLGIGLSDVTGERSNLTRSTPVVTPQPAYLLKFAGCHVSTSDFLIYTPVLPLQPATSSRDAGCNGRTGVALTKRRLHVHNRRHSKSTLVVARQPTSCARCAGGTHPTGAQ